MEIRKNSIVARKEWDDWSVANYRVEAVQGSIATVRNLETYMIRKESVDNLRVRYQVDTFDQGDTVRVRREYADRYNEVDGANELTVVKQNGGGTPATVVKNNNGEEFKILTERLHLVRPGKKFKAGDRVVVDPDLMKKYVNDGVPFYWENVGVLVLTEDSGSRAVKTTSHVGYEKQDGMTNNVPTRWLKLYEEPAKRVVGKPVQARDILVGDTIRATYVAGGMNVTLEGKVRSNISYNGGEPNITAEGGGLFPKSALDPVYILVEEAPEPVDENLQRLLDAEIGDIAHGTYAHEYWKKVGDDEWMLLELDAGFVRTTDHVFGSFYKLKYGTLEFYRKVEDAD